VDVSRFESAVATDLSFLNMAPESQVILSVGRLDPQKDPFLLLETFSILRSSIPNLHLIYAGDGILKTELLEAIAQKHLEKFVHVLGWRADVPSLLKAADVLVLCSRWEGMPNVVLEAFAAGTPVVATNVEGISDLITNRQTGLLITSRNPDELAALVFEVLKDSELSAQMKHLSQRLAREKFTWESSVGDYVKLYESLLETRSGT
jgi:glycosyltransferase involved in cell wall biosynthesis